MNGLACKAREPGAAPGPDSTIYGMDALVRCQALILVESLLGQVESGPEAVAKELGLTFDGEQDWGYKKFWAFTMRDESDPMVGATFYAPVGADRLDIIQLWRRKCAEFGQPSSV